MHSELLLQVFLIRKQPLEILWNPEKLVTKNFIFKYNEVESFKLPLTKHELHQKILKDFV